LRAEVHSQHLPLNDDHLIGQDNKCRLCHLYNQIVTDDDLLKEKLELLREDNLFIDDFNDIRKHAGVVSAISEYRKKHGLLIKKRFGSWENFLLKADKKFNKKI